MAEIDTQSIPVRIIMVIMILAFTPAGAFVLCGAFDGIDQPHLFVMLVFSGSLMLLLGLVGLIGLVASFASKGASRDRTSDEE